jgi:hypothetical protein
VKPLPVYLLAEYAGPEEVTTDIELSSCLRGRLQRNAGLTLDEM